MSRSAVACALLGALPLVLQSPAQALPAATIGRPALITPGAAELAYPTSLDSAHISTLGSGAPPAPEVVELTRALGNNVDEIYDFVHNYVDTVFIFGTQKGAAGTIVDKSGTPFDQALLMVSLLRQAGYAASYKVGTITLSGTDFAAWTNITNAQAACDLLASGGIPASINGGTNSIQCSSITAGSTVSSVTMEHIWVDVVIGGTDYLFDPSYKKYDFSPQLNINSAAGLTTGQALTAATTGLTSSSASGVNYVKSLNGTSLTNTLTNYASGLQTFIQSGNFTPVGQSTTAPLASARILNLVGGREIHHDQVPVTGLRQTTLPYAGSSVSRTWLGDIPNQFRTKLTVQLKKCLSTDVPGSLCTTTVVNQDIYTDDIYSRRLVFNSNFISSGTGFTGTLDVLDDSGSTQHLVTVSTSDVPTLSVGTLTLTLNHPYVADAAGSTSTTGSYMDTVFSRYFRFSTPFAIVYGLGDANHGLIDKWRDVPDHGLPLPPPTDCDPCVKNYFDSAGDGRRQQMAAAWLVQSSKAARLHASIANSIYTHHHSLGIVAGDTVISTVDQTPNGPTHKYIYSVQDNFDRVDIETGYSVTSLTYNNSDRRAAVHAIAATIDALEGSVAGQIADLPDTVSTAARFEWGNAPPAGEDPSAHGARRFYDFTNGNIGTNGANIQPLLLVEGVNSTTNTGQHGAGTVSNPDPVNIGSLETSTREGAVSSLVANYASADPWNSSTSSGWDVVASEEAFLGPGQRAGAFVSTGIGTTYTHNYTEQRGGALVATRYSNGDPVQIAHIAANVNMGAPSNSDGVTNGIKGGGGGAQTNHDSVYDPSKAADILKSLFVDRSQEIGVDLDNGQVTYTSPASLKVGNGDFPFSLTAELIWRGGRPATNGFGPISHVEPQAPFTSNWNNALTISGSALEAMGETDIRATAGTVAAFMAMQDIYRQAISPQREVAAALTSAWWMHQVTGNVATVNLGADTRQFLRKYDGSWLKPGAGEFASLTQTGQRSVYAQRLCTGTAGYTTTRGWDYSSVAYVVTNSHGDQENFGFWSTNYFNPGDNYCGFFHGFRLQNWTFPYGMTVTLNYQSEGSGLFDDLVSVSNSFGRQINLISNGLGGFNNNLSGADLRSVQATPATIGPNDTSVTHTDAAGVQTLINFGGSVNGLVLTSVSANVAPMSSASATPTTPVLAYQYDSLGHVKWAQDGVSLQHAVSPTVCDGHSSAPGPYRDPYCFFFAAGARADRIDPSHADYTIVNDIYGLTHWYVDEIGRTTTVNHDGRGRALSYLFPENNQEVYTYDDHNNATQLTRKAKPNSSFSDISVSATWDQTWNKLLTITDALGCLTTFSYYPSGSGTSLMKNAVRCKPDSSQANPTYAYTYNTFGQPLQVTDPTSLVTLNTYEPGNTGNLQSIAVDPTGVNSVTTFTYYAGGLTKTITDPRLYVTEKQYDLGDRNTVTLHHDLGGITAATLAAERTTFDTLGRVTQREGGITFSGAAVTGWQNLEQLTYTLTNKVLTDQDPAGNSTSYAYDPMDRVQIVTDPVTRRVASVYDAAGQVLSVWRGWDSITPPTSSTTWDPTTYTGTGKIRYASYQYSLNGKQTQILDGNNNVTKLAYDGHDRLLYTLFTDPAAGSSTCTVAAATVSGYDSVAPTCNTTLPHQQTYEKYSYYPNGSQSAVRKRDGQVIGFTIDALGRETIKDLPGTTTGDVYYGYDLAGRPTYALFGSTSGTGVIYGFDTAKRVTSEATFGRSVGYGYDAANNRTSVSWPDISTSIIYDYDGLNRASQVHESGSTSGPGLLAVYGYDPLSHRTSITRGNGVNTGFGYDTDLRLKALTHDAVGTAQDLSLQFDYTFASQLQKRWMSNSLYTWAPATASKTYATDALNRYTSVNTTTAFNYDGRGNLTGDGTRIFTYDVENHLLTESGGPAPLTLSYDPLGRVYQTISGSTTTQFLYAGDKLIGEYPTSGTALRRYVHGPGTDDPIVWYEGSTLSDRRWLLADERGSIVAKTDSGGNAAVYTYGPFGEPSTWAGPRFAYTGQVALPEAQLYHYKARVYDPVLGRFLQTDPVGTQDDLDLYAYGRGDPIDRVDMGGTWSAEVHNKVMMDAFGVRMGLAMAPTSVWQDTVYGSRNYMHFLRDPNQPVGQAIAQYKQFVHEKLDLARSLNSTGDPDNRSSALANFTDAVHAIMDSFSPVHNHGGEPQVYDPSWDAIDAAKHGHSPLDSAGAEGLAALTPKIEKAMIKELRKAYDYVYKKGPADDLRIPAMKTNHCAETVSCKSGSDIVFWD